MPETYEKTMAALTALQAQKKNLLGNKTFKDLSMDEMITVCRLNKLIFTAHWACFERAKEEDKIEIALEHFLVTHENFIKKANDLFKNPSPTQTSKLNIDNKTEAKQYLYKGLAYKIGVLKPNHKKALDYLKKAAKCGDAVALYLLGVIKSDLNKIQKATAYFNLAADRGHIASQGKLGLAYAKEERSEQAISWLTRAAEHENSQAQNNLGLMCHSNKQYDLAIKWFTLSAEQGNPSALYNLAEMHRKGDGIREDKTWAIYWTVRALLAGHPKALTTLSQLDPALANYTMAVNQHNFAELFKLLLTHKELQKRYFEQDLSANLSTFSLSCLNDFFSTMHVTLNSFEQFKNAFLIDTLLTLDRHQVNKPANKEDCDNELDEAITEEMELIINQIHFAEVNKEQINPLMFYLCNLLIRHHSQEVIKALLCLWHKLRALELDIEDPCLKKLFAQTLISSIYTGKYELKLTTTLSKNELTLLVCCYELNSDLLSKEQKDALLIENKRAPGQSLPSLVEHGQAFFNSKATPPNSPPNPELTINLKT